MKFQVRIGEEFAVEDVEILRAITKERTEQTRRILAVSILALSSVFLTGAAMLGLVDGHFSKLETVSAIVAAPLSALIAYYFIRSRPKDTT